MIYGEWLDRIRYTDDMDGGGRLLAPVFAAALKGRRFKRCFEWCAGPAWIGFWLLEVGICEELVAADINARAVEMVNMTGGATAYLSDNMKTIPKDEKFDLVVSNPPNYCNIQASHPLGYLRHDQRPSDVGWDIHRDFYATIGPYLNVGAELWISEVEPFDRQVWLNGDLYDQRPQLPIIDFANMLNGTGLRLESVKPFKLGKAQMGLLKIR